MRGEAVKRINAKLFVGALSFVVGLKGVVG